MDTIRLTYSPYGFGKFLKVITAEMPTDDDTQDGGEGMGTVPKAQTASYYVMGGGAEENRTS